MRALPLEDLQIPFINYGSDEIRLDPCPKRVRAFVEGHAVIDSTRAQMMREPGHLPVYYFPKQDVRMDLLTPNRSPEKPGRKGGATLWSLRVGERTVEEALFSYEESPAGCPDLSGLIGMYWSRMDAVFEQDEEVFAHARDPYHRIETTALLPPGAGSVGRPGAGRDQPAGDASGDSTASPVLLPQAGLPFGCPHSQFDCQHVSVQRPCNAVLVGRRRD